MLLLRRKSLIIITLFLLAGLFFWLFFAQSNTSSDTKTYQARAALTVNIESPQRELVPRTIRANGNIAAWQEAIIGTEIHGLRLSEIRVNVGDQVRKGQVLARFTSEMVAAELAQARANLVEAQAHAKEAQLNAQRARQLDQTGALSTTQIDQLLTAEKASQARTALAAAQVQAQQLRLSYTQVTAPEAGIISARSATLGSVLNTGTELFRMILQGRLEWRAELTASELAPIQVGMPVNITLDNGQTLSGIVRTISPAVETQSRNALVYVDLPSDAAKQAKAGMFARGEFTLSSAPALTLSQSAVLMQDGSHYVYVVDAQQRVAQVKVITGKLHQDRMEIVSGLSPKAQVVSQGASFLNHGDQVRIAPKASTTR